MRRILTTLVSCTLAALTQAADPPVVAQLTISDGQRLVQHFKAGVFGRLWSDPALAPLRARVDEQMPMIEAELGFSPLALPESLTSAQATMFGLPVGATAADVAAYKKSPDFGLQAGLGKLAAQIFAKFKDAGEPAVVLGASEALLLPRQQGTLVRIGEMLLMGSRAKRLIPTPIAPSEHDLTVSFHGQFLADTIRNTLTPQEVEKADLFIKALHRFLVPMTSHVDFTPTHVASYAAAQTTLPFLTPADLTLCGRLPATAYSVSAIGFDGAVLWDDLIAPLLAAAAASQGTTAEALVQPANEQLNAFGATTSVQDLVSGLRGTVLFAQTPGAPFPGYTLGIPRSPALDQVLSIVLKQLGNELPAEGEAMPLAFPNVPLPVNLVRDRGHWVITTDTTLATTWSTTPDGGWLASPLGKLATEKSVPGKVGKGALMLSVSDTAAELRAMQGYVGMGLGSLPLEPKEKQAVMRAFSMLITNAGLSYEVLQQRGDSLVSEGQSMLGGSSIAVVAIIAAIAIPNLLESRVAANEAAAAMSLKSGVFPAQVQFQGGGYRDLDGDGIGEFGFFSEMSGGPVAGLKNDIKLKLLDERWNSPLPEVNGYNFVMYLPDGQGGAYGATDKLPEKIADAANAGEKYFVAYAWPIDDSNGRRAFALTNAGTVYSIFANELPEGVPAWNTVFGGEGKGWQDQPVWPQHQRRDGGPRPAPQQKAEDPADAPAF